MPVAAMTVHLHICISMNVFVLPPLWRSTRRRANGSIWFSIRPIVPRYLGISTAISTSADRDATIPWHCHRCEVHRVLVTCCNTTSAVYAEQWLVHYIHVHCGSKHRIASYFGVFLQQWQLEAQHRQRGVVIIYILIEHCNSYPWVGVVHCECDGGIPELVGEGGRRRLICVCCFFDCQ